MQYLHPDAVVLARASGTSREEAGRIIRLVADDNPGLLVGGYNADAFILAAWLALRAEAADKPGIDEDFILANVNAAVHALWAGVL